MILEQCKGVHCVDLGESFQTHLCLQNLASIQPLERALSCVCPTPRFHAAAIYHPAQVESVKEEDGSASESASTTDATPLPDAVPDAECAADTGGGVPTSM